jgi:Cd2+/Zn2+-exporting ATPase
VNGGGALEVRVGRLAKDSTLQRVMRLVEEAQESQSPTQLSTERFMRLFVPAVLAVDVLVMLVPPLFGAPFNEAFRRAMTLLVAASPCALALGAPSAILAGVARAARGGVLVKGGVHLENLGRIKAVAFDKTGTLTYGRPEVTDVIPAEGWQAEELLRLAAGVESRSAHPLAQAVTRAAAGRGLALPATEDAEAVIGRGFQARVDGRAALVGNQKLLEEAGVQTPEELRRQAEMLESQGRTALWVAVNDNADGERHAAWQMAGFLAVADRMRPEAPAAIAAQRRAGVQRVALFSGDHRLVASAVGAQAGVDEALGELMPEQKLEAVRALERQMGATAMIGDGVNDAPALAAATVGIAMGGAGSDAALETADVALMGDDLSRLPFAVALGRASGAVIRQNLIIALSVIILLAVAALTGYVGLGLAVFLHEGSTVVVVLNSLRLLRF